MGRHVEEVTNARRVRDPAPRRQHARHALPITRAQVGEGGGHPTAQATPSRLPCFMQVDQNVEGVRVGRRACERGPRRRGRRRRVRQQGPRRRVPVIPRPRRDEGVGGQGGRRVRVGVGGGDRVHGFSKSQISRQPPLPSLRAARKPGGHGGRPRRVSGGDGGGGRHRLRGDRQARALGRRRGRGRRVGGSERGERRHVALCHAVIQGCPIGTRPQRQRDAAVGEGGGRVCRGRSAKRGDRGRRVKPAQQQQPPVERELSGG